jgi:hypothetical protein
VGTCFLAIRMWSTERSGRSWQHNCRTDWRDVLNQTAATRDLAGVELLVVGGRTQAHGLSPALRSFLDGLSAEAVRDVATATFDAWLTWTRFLAGSAAAAAAKRLQKKGARLMTPPKSFLVKGLEGPLVEGELERARTWATRVRFMTATPEREPAGAIR